MSATISSPVSLTPLHPEVKRFISQPKKLYIDGEWRDSVSGKTFPTYNPATGEILADVAEADRADVDQAVSAGRRAFDSGPWSSMTPSDRGRMIWDLADLIAKHLEQFAQLDSLDNGKPLHIARIADVPMSVDLFRYMAGWATKIEGNTIPLSARNTEYFAYTKREPVGVVAQIIPWNFPLMMAAWKIAPALAAGCTVVLKPAEQTPLSALLLAEMVERAGFPPGVVNVIPGYGETAGAALAAHEQVDKVAFTGSTEIGKLVLQAAAGNLKKVSLELGGKSPNLIFADANLELAIAGAANAIFFNQGQCCSAGSRLYIERSIFDKVVSGVVEEARKIKLGNGFESDTSMGPLVSEEQLNRVCRYLEAGFQEGAHAIVGGRKLSRPGYFVEPTVMLDTSPHMKIVREEIFGPVVCAIPFDDIFEVVSAANQSEFGLAAGLWTRDLSKAHRVAGRLRVGTVWINCYNIGDAALPFGGYKQSGWGREMGHDALNLYTEVKAVCAAI